MKKSAKFLSMLLVAVFAFMSIYSCRNDDDPADNDFFVGTYKGKVTYTDTSKNITNDNGSVTVTKIASGTKYNFAFSSSIPDLNGVEFKQTGDHTLVSTGSVTAYIKIDEKKLTINYLKDGKLWTADASR